MRDRQSCERRAYRLAALLTGSPVAAVGVMEAAIEAQPDLQRLDGAHLDRLTVLRSREVEASAMVDDAVPRAVAEALASLPSQHREAWVFVNVYRLPQRQTARAMDCSVTATQRHLALAEEAMAKRLGDGARDAHASLLRYSMALEVPEFYRAGRRRRRRLRRLMVAVVAAAILVAMMEVVRWLSSG